MELVSVNSSSFDKKSDNHLIQRNLQILKLGNSSSHVAVIFAGEQCKDKNIDNRP